MIYTIINFILTILCLIFWKKDKLKYAEYLFYLGILITSISAWADVGGDMFHVANLSSKLFLIIFAGVSWKKSLDKFWYKLALINIGLLFLTVYSFYIEKSIFLAGSMSLIVSETAILLLHSLFLSLLVWILLPLTGVNKKNTLIIAILMFIFLAYFDIKPISNIFW